MTKRLAPEVKQSRRPTRVACEFCHSKHLQCDEARPCSNCVKRGHAGTCRDAVRRKKRAPPRGPLQPMAKEESNGLRKKRKYKKRKKKEEPVDNTESDQKQATFLTTESPAISGNGGSLNGSISGSVSSLPGSIAPRLTGANLIRPAPLQSISAGDKTFEEDLPFNLSTNTLTRLLTPSPDMQLNQAPSASFPRGSMPTISDDSDGADEEEDRPLEFRAPSRSIDSSHMDGFSDMSTASQGSGSRNGSSSRNFQSNTANEEYIKLTDLLQTNSPSPSEGGFWGAGTNESDDHSLRPYIEIGIEENTMRSSYHNNQTPNSYVYNEQHSQMPNTAREIPHDLQEDDDYTSPLIMRHVIKKPDDIYLTSIVKAYQYPKAYHALIAYLKRRFNKEQLIEIAKCMAKYRPSFISATKSLYENDLIFTERSFQRTLLEYEQLISLSPSPTIIWRRTGEIVALTNEFATMTGYSKMSLLSKRTFIVELMDDESTLKYFRSFSAMAFGDLNATYLTDCNLRKADDANYLKCCCVWTIKRDVFDIPMLIVGQFLPVLN